MSPHNVRISHNITGVVQRVRRSEMLSTGLRRRGYASSAKRQLRAGTPLNQDTLTKRLQAHKDRHPGIPSFRLKDLRAFTATMLEATGTDITTA